MIYSVVALLIRIFLSFSLVRGIVVWRGNQPLLRVTGIGGLLYLAIGVSLLLGLYVYVSTLVLLLLLGIRLWQKWKQKKKMSKKDYLLLILTIILFLKGSGEISLDRLMGII